ncbi:MAG: hypothetical protein KAU31_08730, partial [Spirochaetaceae bacterium]|nr:hypothetical protein [Spirochaetaceae bacterium]
MWSDEEKEIHRLEVELRLTRDELQVRDERSSELEEQVSTLQEAIPGLQGDIRELQLQASTGADEHAAEIELLQSERQALLLDLERLANAAEIAAAQAAQAMTARSETAAEPTSATNQTALANAMGGLGGFRRVEDLGFQSDSRLGSRLAVTGSGLAVDSAGEDPVLFDADLSFDSSLIYLTITDPAGRDPRLVLTVQYVSDVRPLYTQTAFISIQGNDPIDPIDPVIFTGSPVRETDGVRIREAFSREV